MNKISKEDFDKIQSVLKNVVEEDQVVSRYREALNETAERFNIELEELEEDELDDVYSEWNDHVNMSASNLKKWSKNPCSREASKDPVAVIKRNLRLLERNKDEWTDNDIEDAKRTISFISRMKAQRPDSPREGPHGCPSEWAISLLNWAFNPFDSVPTPSSETKEDLDPVEEVNLASELQEERRNIKEAEMLAEQVWMLKDIMEEFNKEFESIARDLETEKDMEEVRSMREQTESAIDLMISKLQSPIEEVKNNDVEELKSHSFEFEPIPNQVLYVDEGDAMERANDLGLEGTHEHPVLFDMNVDDLPEDVRENVTVHYMAGDTHQDWVERVKSVPEEMSETKKAEQIFHANQERHKNNKAKEDSGVDVPPVAICQVEDDGLEMNEDIEDVLNDLWDENQE